VPTVRKVDELLRLKGHCLSVGIQLTEAAAWQLSCGGEVPLTVHEYATTGGVTFRIDDVFVNAPFDEWFCEQSRAKLDVNGDRFEVLFDDMVFACEVLPLPGYLDQSNSLGHRVTDTTMSHCDRIRVSPITGCSLDCGFCDFPALRYTRHGADEVLASLEIAKADQNLPARHLLVSGGSPGPRHFEWFDTTLIAIIASSGLPTDVMMSPREGGTDHVRRFADAGAQGFSLNLEVFGDRRADDVMPLKHRRSSPYLEETIRAAVDSVGSDGRVRSLVIVGLDEPADTLAAVKFLADLGCEPVLSPFRPARNTRLAMWKPPEESLLIDIYGAAADIVAASGLKLGPRCIPCQHNTLVIAQGIGDYYYT
jgi:pyruvate-formate lyase-activating enzyme